MLLFCELAAFKLASLTPVLQVWTRKTSNCLQVLLCPVGGALATVRPVRSRSSAALAASRDPASRKLSDQPEDTHSPCPPLLHTPPLGLPGLRLYLTFRSFDFLLRLYGRCSGRRYFVFNIEENYSEYSCCSKLSFRSFITKTSLSVGGGASHLDSVFQAPFQSLL